MKPLAAERQRGEASLVSAFVAFARRMRGQALSSRPRLLWAAPQA